MPGDTAETWQPYRYTPSTILAAVFLFLFGITTLVHFFQLFRTRTWYLIPLVVGGVFIGFIGRLSSRDNNISVLGPFIIQAIFILLAPTLFAASIYIILGRIILLVDGERYSWIRQKHLTAAFVAGDVLSFQLQGNGGGLTSGKSTVAIRLGEVIIIVGLFAQLAFFGLFVAVAAVFHRRLINDKPVKKHLSFRWFRWLRFLRVFRFWKRNTNAKSTSGRPTSSAYVTNTDSAAAVNIDELPWKRHIYVLYVTSILILIRSIFRVVEYIQGEDGYLLGHEVYLYVFDATLMVVVMILFNWVHPSQITEVYEERMRLREGDRTMAGLELRDTDRTEMDASERGRSSVEHGRKVLV
ncbi:RTA1-domain-containing protein [Melanomma pulvis-pyrius CBS 109.77]|uniref:RTA1-domain-containing protein n=1 Tax=Melanomma pulvis-pyrius CBS 109.77 TaxID=1314802 RepID=A0A6A6WQB3_9PLEO|nr:RTA1-domain-containing protein [Melanomma pulvis-pyrius CBS 109.77]